MRGVSSILSLFLNGFNKFNNTGARKLDSIYHYDVQITLKSHFWCEKRKDFDSIYATFLFYFSVHCTHCKNVSTMT